MALRSGWNFLADDPEVDNAAIGRQVEEGEQWTFREQQLPGRPDRLDGPTLAGTCLIHAGDSRPGIL